MKYRRKLDKKTNRELTIEALEILKKEGIDVTKIAPKRRVNGEKNYILLKDVRDENIDKIIKKYDLDPNLKIGSQIYILRTKTHILNYDEKERIEKLGIKKQEKETKNKIFKNNIEEAIYIFEKLHEKGVDIPFIQKNIGDRFTKLKDIHAPNILNIIEELGLESEYPIGLRKAIIEAEYKNRRNDYHFEKEEKEKVDKLGILNTIGTNVKETLRILERLSKDGVDISLAGKRIKLANGLSRDRYIFEIEDKNIEKILKKNNIPKFLLIGKRIKQIERIMNNNKIDDSIRKELSQKMLDYKIIKYKKSREERE